MSLTFLSFYQWKVESWIKKKNSLTYSSGFYLEISGFKCKSHHKKWRFICLYNSYLCIILDILWVKILSYLYYLLTISKILVTHSALHTYLPLSSFPRFCSVKHIYVFYLLSHKIEQKADIFWLHKYPSWSIFGRTTFDCVYSCKSSGKFLCQLCISGFWFFCHSCCQNCLSAVKLDRELWWSPVFKTFHRFSS